METVSYLLRLRIHEKKLLQKICKEKNTTIIDYIKNRLFFNNADIEESIQKFDSPPESEHNYNSALILEKIYNILLCILAEQVGSEKSIDIKKTSIEFASKNLAKKGYYKINNKIFFDE